jgi:two-component system, response regulator YesN
MSINVQTVRAFIEENFHKVQGPSDIAEALDVNYHTLRAVFKREMGYPLRDELSRAIRAEVEHLLLNSGLHCDEILYRVGFARADSGHKWFKRLTGMTMEEFRRKFNVLSKSRPSA